LQEKGSLSYVDLMKTLGITNTGKMNYHLKVLGNLLSKKDGDQYVLSEKGMLAYRLMQEFSEANTERQLKLNSREPQVLWDGVIILVFALIGWFALFQRFLYGGFMDVDAAQLLGPFFFVCAIFSFIGLYMIVSDLRKNRKTSRALGKLAKSAVILFTIALIVLGVSLVRVSITFPESARDMLGLWTGLFTLLAGVISLLGFEVDELFHGRRTGIFWWGLIFFGLALSSLFGVLWSGIFAWSSVLSLNCIEQILASLVFSFIGFRMMKKGTVEESQTHSTLESRMSALEFYLSQRNYRGLVYLAASALITALALDGVVLNGGIFVYVDPLGFYLAFIGYWFLGWFDRTSIQYYALLAFGLFVEIFMVCEFFISLTNSTRRAREPAASVSQQSS
jgi:MFS family permease